MELKVISENFDQNTFNEVANHPMQSWEWGEARKKMGIEILRFGEYSKDMLKQIFQITLHQIPYTPWKIAYLPRSQFPSIHTLTYLKNNLLQKNVIFLQIEPYVYKNSNLKNIQNSLTLLQKSHHPLFPDWTQILDLKPSEEELLNKMHHKTRYNIRLAQKKGIAIKEVSDDEGFNVFSQLYFETCKRQKYYGHSQKYHQLLWNFLKKNIAHILIAYYQDIPLAAYELFNFKNILYYPYGGSSELHRNFMAPNLLMWEAIKLGKKLGAHIFDMWGSLPRDYNVKNPWSGFTRFKEGYHTQFIEFIGSYNLVIQPLLYHAYTVADDVRSFYLKIKQLG